MSRSLPGVIALVLVGALLMAGCVTQPGAGPATTTTPTVSPVATGAANQSPSSQELVAFVEEAAALARTNGRDSSLAAFNDPNGSWIRGELYIFAYDMNGTVLALPFQPESIGTSRFGIVDIDGVPFVQEAIAAARNGSGTFRYRYPNPARNDAVEEKTSFVVGLGDWFVGAGLYAPGGEEATNVSTRTRPGLVTFVEKAAGFARTNGPEGAIRAFNDPNGSFVEDDLYVFAYGMNGTVLALPFQPELVGVNRSDAADIHGTKYIQAAVAAAKNGSGFYELYYPNPADHFAVEPKTCYVVGMGDWFLGSGYYTARLAVNATNLSTRESLATFVEQAAAHARTVGKEQALADFNDRAGQFASGEVYVYALDYDGVALALPFQPEKVGTSFIDLVDSTGQYYTRVEIDQAQRGGGFVYYDYPNPAHGLAVEPKMSYVRDVDGTYWIGAGTYLPVVNGTVKG